MNSNDQSINSGVTKAERTLRACWFVFLCSLLMFLMTGCAVTPKTVPHSFAFAAYVDSPNIEVLDYRYGVEKTAIVRAPEWRVQQGEPTQQTGYFGDMPLGEELYVKWRIKSTKEIFERTVNLRMLLPEQMRGKVLTFTVIDKEIEVFVVERTLKRKDAPSLGPKTYELYQVEKIYPTYLKNF